MLGKGEGKTTARVSWLEKLGQRDLAHRAEDQLPGMLLSFTGALRAGFSLHRALQTAAEETPAPLGPALGRCAAEVALGIPWMEALESVRHQYPSEGMTLFVWALSLHLRTGGDLPSLGDRLHELLTERRKLSARLSAATAQSRFSAGVIMFVPVFLAASLHQLSPGYLRPLVETRAGWALLVWAGLMNMLGLMVIRRLSVLKW